MDPTCAAATPSTLLARHFGQLCGESRERHPRAVAHCPPPPPTGRRARRCGSSFPPAAVLCARCRRPSPSPATRCLKPIARALPRPPACPLSSCLALLQALDKVRFMSLTDSAVLGEGDTSKLEMKVLSPPRAPPARCCARAPASPPPTASPLCPTASPLPHRQPSALPPPRASRHLTPAFAFPVGSSSRTRRPRHSP